LQQGKGKGKGKGKLETLASKVKKDK